MEGYMRIFTLFTLVAISLGGFGCRKPTPIREFQKEQAALDPDIMPRTTTKDPSQPEWVDNADRKGVLTAVGMAQPNKLQDIHLQRTQATNRAYAELARKLQVNTDSLYQEAVATTEAAGKKISEKDTRETHNTIHNLVSVKLKGVKVPSFWTDKYTGNLFVLVVLNENASYEILTEATHNQPFLQDAIKRLKEAKAEALTAPK
jgi:hypothetical protein